MPGQASTGDGKGLTVEGWLTFWKWAYLIGLISFAVLVVAVIPLGARDLIRLFRHLERRDPQDDEE